MVSEKKYYIKENILYSSNFKMFELPHQDYSELSIPNQTKNHLINNKIILDELNKVLNIKGREIKLSLKISNFDEIKVKIEEAKNNNSKEIKFSEPSGDDYEFIERTSQIDLLENLIEQYEKNESFEEFENKLQIYLKYNGDEETKKVTQLLEQIEVEDSKKNQYLNEKEEFMKLNINPILFEINLLEKGIETLKSKQEKFDKDLQKSQNTPKNKNMIKLDKNREIQVLTIREIKNLNLEIKILKAEIDTIKDDIKMGKKYCPNILLVIFTLGLIYYTKYSTCKYQILRKKNKINKKKEKILRLEKKKSNLEDENEEIMKKEQGVSKMSAQIEDSIHKKIDKINSIIQEKEKEIKKHEKEVKDSQKDISKFDSNIEKINEKLLELNVLKEEFDKYSKTKIEKVFAQVVEDKNKKLEMLKDLKKTIEEQKIGINGDWIVNFT